MYENPVCDYLPRKYNTYQLRLTTGGENMSYPSDSGSPTATLLEAKIPFNRVISTLVPNLFAHISRNIFSTHLLRASNISKYLSAVFLKRYASSTIYTLLLNLTATFITNE